MAKWRLALAFILILVWTATPALACLPTSTMTQAEMACCKKMAGNCHMGVGKHPCCKTVTSTDVPVAALQPTTQVQPSFAVVALVPLLQEPPLAEFVLKQANLGLPPPAPSGLTSILRI